MTVALTRTKAGLVTSRLKAGRVSVTTWWPAEWVLAGLTSMPAPVLVRGALKLLWCAALLESAVPVLEELTGMSICTLCSIVPCKYSPRVWNATFRSLIKPLLARGQSSGPLLEPLLKRGQSTPSLIPRPSCAAVSIYRRTRNELTWVIALPLHDTAYSLCYTSHPEVTLEGSEYLH